MRLYYFCTIVSASKYIEYMPLNLPDKLPAIDLLKNENIFVMDNGRASTQDIRPLKIVILNLMPLKITTETDLIRLLSNTPLQLEIDFMKIKSHTSKNTPIEHMKAFYKTFYSMRDQKYDGMIVTGAPVELLDFKDVTYWDEITQIFDWAKKHVTSTFFICWAAQAGLNYHYGIPKYPLEKKMFGVFKHEMNDPKNPIFRGFDDEFFVPHSRHTEIRREDILKVPELTILSESEESGVYMVMAKNGREFYITGHSEYSPNTLDTEYKRDLAKGLQIDIPKNYYKDNDPKKTPLVRWRGHANLLFSNWLNYFVYQETPFDINQIH
jgi:homoserine O-succinyltransferase/O-acetyltransferase